MKTIRRGSEPAYVAATGLSDLPSEANRVLLLGYDGHAANWHEGYGRPTVAFERHCVVEYRKLAIADGNAASLANPEKGESASGGNEKREVSTTMSRKS